MHKENPAGRAIAKLLTAFELKPDHQRYFVRPVSREEAEANTACTSYDLRASEAAPYIPGCKVVIVTTGLVWDQKGQTHSTLNTHMENVDLLIGYYWGTPGRVLVEWRTDKEHTALSF